MNKIEPAKDMETSQPSTKEPASKGKSWRGIAAIVYAILLLVVFGSMLFALVPHAAGSELHSYILLIPIISGYLIFVQRDQLPRGFSTSFGIGSFVAVVGVVVLVLVRAPNSLLGPLSGNDYFTLETLSLVCLLVAGGFFFLGRKWMAAAAFPVAFFFFTVPMPDAMADALETASQLASAEATSLFFTISGMTFLRDGNVFQLPNIAIRVAQECSGIRSSWILFITSLLASYLFLRTPWRRAVLVAFVIPLGIIRNGFRILVIGWLCVRLGPQMIDSVIHHRGGPLFFALSLVPLFLLLWWLRRREAAKAKPQLAV